MRAQNTTITRLHEAQNQQNIHGIRRTLARWLHVGTKTLLSQSLLLDTSVKNSFRHRKCQIPTTSNNLLDAKS
jgi:hypothetical protein